jgi:hypothetical protein
MDMKYKIPSYQAETSSLATQMTSETSNLSFLATLARRKEMHKSS